MDVISVEAQTGLQGTADSPENGDGDGAVSGGKLEEIREWRGGARERGSSARTRGCEEGERSKNDCEMFSPACAVAPGDSSSSACLL